MKFKMITVRLVAKGPPPCTRLRGKLLATLSLSILPFWSKLKVTTLYVNISKLPLYV